VQSLVFQRLCGLCVRNRAYNKVECIRLNPVRACPVKRPEGWPWSSVHDYTGSVMTTAVSASGTLAVDRVLLPASERARI